MTADPSGAFVGRAGELDVLAARLARARAGRAQIVVLQGPPGVGKSALVRELLRRVGDGPLVLSAGGEEAEELVAYGVLDQLARSADPPRAAGWELRAATEPAAAGAELLGALSGAGRPCVVVLDDAQWADLPSVQALVFALRRLGPSPVLTVVVTRDGAADGRIARLVRLGAAPDGCTIAMSGLAVPDLVELAGARGHPRLPRRAAERVHAHTGGSPLHATALFDEVPRDALRDPGRPLPCPATYALLVTDRLRQCSAPARALVRAAAVLGERCSPAVAHRVAHGPRAGAPDPAVLDEVVAARLLVADPDGAGPIGPGGTGLAFAHRLVRAAVTQDLDVGERLRLHARAAELVTDADRVLAHRVAASLDRDPELAADLVRRADELEAGDETARAGAHLVDAARLHPDGAGRAVALLRAVELFVTAGESGRADALADTVAALPAQAAREHALARLEFARGRPARAEELSRSAWERASDTGLRARIAGFLCHVCYLQLRHDEAIEWGRRARALGPGHAVALVTSLALAGRDPDAAAVADDPSAGGAETALARGAARLWREEPAAAYAELAAVSASLRGSGQFQIRLHATGYLVLAGLRTGRWAEAAGHADEVVSLAADAEQDWVLARLHSYAAMVHAVRGDPGRAARHIADARAAAAVTGLGLDRVGSTIAAAQVAATAGEHAEVVRLLEPLADPARLGRLADPGVSQWPCVLAEALVAVDRVGEADALLMPFERRSEELGRRLAASAAARARARIEATRDRAAARRALDRAVALADAAGGTVEAALARLDLGALLRRAGRRREAAEALYPAAAELTRMAPDGPAAAHCARELEACGLTPAPRGAGPGRRLTPRELAVARLAADGRSNPQVAEELAVSLNTVEYHLRNVFGKLGITSRVQLAGRLDD